MKAIRIRPLALREYVEASTWHETQSRGLGIQFEREVEKTLISIGQTPLRYAIVSGKVRCAPVTRFPYAVYFRIFAEIDRNHRDLPPIPRSRRLAIAVVTASRPNRQTLPIPSHSAGIFVSASL